MLLVNRLTWLRKGGEEVVVITFIKADDFLLMPTFSVVGQC